MPEITIYSIVIISTVCIKIHDFGFDLIRYFTTYIQTKFPLLKNQYSFLIIKRLNYLNPFYNTLEVHFI